MTVYVVICTDPADQGSECWAHGVYTDRETARRVLTRLRDTTNWTVRWNAKRIRDSVKNRSPGGTLDD